VSGDFFTINVDSWGFGGGNGVGGTYESLVNGDLHALGNVADDTFANLFLANSSGATINGDTNLVVYTEGSFSGSLAQLVNALHTSGGAINFHTATVAGDTYDLLFAYNTGSATDIAEIQFEGNGTTSTQGMTVTNEHNLVALTGVTAGGLFAEYLAHHANLFFTT
jgi:filamentous hemagglutinin family protein